MTTEIFAPFPLEILSRKDVPTMASLEDLTKQLGLMTQLLTKLTSEKAEKAEKPAEKPEEVSTSKEPEVPKPQTTNEKVSISQNENDSVVVLEGSFSNHRPEMIFKREPEDSSEDEDFPKKSKKKRRIVDSSSSSTSSNSSEDEPEKHNKSDLQAEKKVNVFCIFNAIIFFSCF